MANPKPIRVPVSAFRSYNKRMRAKILRPLFDAFAKGLRQAQSISQAYSALSVVSLTRSQWDEAIAAGVSQHAEAVEQFHRRKFVRSFRTALGVDVADIIDDDISSWLSQYRRENIALIKTIPERAHDDLFNAMSKQFAKRPFDQKELMSVLNTQFQSSGYNLRRLTRDQTNKAIGQLTEVRQRNSGVQKYIWRTAGDERVRDAHNNLSGTLQRWDKAPATGHPGHAIQCRCSAEAVVDAEAIEAAMKGQRRARTASVVAEQRKPKSIPFGALSAFKARSPGLDNGVARKIFNAKHPAFSPTRTRVHAAGAAPEPDALTLLIADWNNVALSGDLAAAKAARQEVRYEIDWLLGTVTDPDELKMINRLRNTLNQTSALDGKTKRIDSNLLDIRNARKTPTTTIKPKLQTLPEDTPLDPLQGMHFDHPKFAALDTYNDDARNIVTNSTMRDELNEHLLDFELHYIEAITPSAQKNADLLSASMKQFESDDLPLLFYSTDNWSDDLVEGSLVKLDGFPTVSANPAIVGSNEGRLLVEIHAPDGVRAIISPTEASFILDRNRAGRIKNVFADVDVPNVGKVERYVVVELEAHGINISPLSEVPYTTKNGLPAFIDIEDGFTPPRPDSPMRRKPRLALDDMPDETGRQFVPDFTMYQPSDYGTQLSWPKRHVDNAYFDFQQANLYRAEFNGFKHDYQIISERQAQLIVDDIAHSAGIEPYKVAMVRSGDEQSTANAINEMVRRGVPEESARQTIIDNTDSAGITLESGRMIILYDHVNSWGHTKHVALHEASHMVAAEVNRLDQVVLNASKIRGQSLPAQVVQRFDEGSGSHGTIFSDIYTDVRQMWLKEDRNDINKVWRDWKVQSSEVRAPGFTYKPLVQVDKSFTDLRPRGETFRLDQPRAPPAATDIPVVPKPTPVDEKTLALYDKTIGYLTEYVAVLDPADATFSTMVKYELRDGGRALQKAARKAGANDTVAKLDDFLEALKNGTIDTTSKKSVEDAVDTLRQAISSSPSSSPVPVPPTSAATVVKKTPSNPYVSGAPSLAAEGKPVRPQSKSKPFRLLNPKISYNRLEELLNEEQAIHAARKGFISEANSPQGLLDYQINKFELLNKHTRDGVPLTPDLQRIDADILSAVHTFDADDLVPLYRGMFTEETYEVGGRYTFNSWTSTSTNTTYAAEFINIGPPPFALKAKSTFFEIHGKAGMEGVVFNSDQLEVLLKRGTKFEVDAVFKDLAIDGIDHIDQYVVVRIVDDAPLPKVHKSVIPDSPSMPKYDTPSGFATDSDFDADHISFRLYDETGDGAKDFDAYHVALADIVSTHRNRANYVADADLPQGARKYIGEGYSDFNRRARKGNLRASDRSMESDLLSITHELGDDAAPLYRGMRTNEIYEEGKDYVFDAWTSTATSPLHSQKFLAAKKGRRGANATMFEIHTTSQTRGAVFNQHEFEVLLQRGTKFRVQRVHKNVQVKIPRASRGVATQNSVDIDQYVVVQIIDDSTPPSALVSSPKPQPTPKLKPKSKRKSKRKSTPKPQPTPTAAAPTESINEIVEAWDAAIANGDQSQAFAAKLQLRKHLQELANAATDTAEKARIAGLRKILRNTPKTSPPPQALRTGLVAQPSPPRIHKSAIPEPPPKALRKDAPTQTSPPQVHKAAVPEPPPKRYVADAPSIARHGKPTRPEPTAFVQPVDIFDRIENHTTLKNYIDPSVEPDSLVYYNSFSYEDFNRYQRDGIPLTPKMHEVEAELLTLTNELDTDRLGTLYRGMYTDQRFQAGQRFVAPSWHSTTTDVETAFQFFDFGAATKSTHRNTIFEIHSRPGLQGIIFNPNEMEVLLKRGTKFEVDAVFDDVAVAGNITEIASEDFVTKIDQYVVVRIIDDTPPPPGASQSIAPKIPPPLRPSDSEDLVAEVLESTTKPAKPIKPPPKPTPAGQGPPLPQRPAAPTVTRPSAPAELKAPSLDDQGNIRRPPDLPDAFFLSDTNMSSLDYDILLREQKDIHKARKGYVSAFDEPPGLSAYAVQDYGPLNQTLREGDPLTDKLQKIDADILSATRILDEEDIVPLYRGVIDDLETYQVGEEYVFPSWTSTSTDASTAAAFLSSHYAANNTFFEIHGATGMKGVIFNSDEMEVLLKRGTKFEVEAVFPYVEIQGVEVIDQYVVARIIPDTPPPPGVSQSIAPKIPPPPRPSTDPTTKPIHQYISDAPSISSEGVPKRPSFDAFFNPKRHSERFDDHTKLKGFIVRNDEPAGLNAYKSEAYQDLNELQRSGIPLPAHLRAVEADLLDVTDELDVDDIGTLYRGIYTDQRYEAGQKHTFPSWTSTTTNAKTAFGFLDIDKAQQAYRNTVFEIHGAPGMRGIVYNASEMEVLLQRGTKFEVDAVFDNVDTSAASIDQYVVVRIIPDTPPPPTVAQSIAPKIPPPPKQYLPGAPSLTNSDTPARPPQSGADTFTRHTSESQHTRIKGYLAFNDEPPSLRNYKQYAYRSLNEYTRSGRALTAGMKKIEDDLLKVTHIFDEDELVPLYRGAFTDDAYEVGGQYSFASWTSTSTDGSVAADFISEVQSSYGTAKSTFFEIHGAPGMEAIVYNIGEFEVLLKRGTKFEVDAIFKDVAIDEIGETIDRYIVVRILNDTPPPPSVSQSIAPKIPPKKTYSAGAPSLSSENGTPSKPKSVQKSGSRTEHIARKGFIDWGSAPQGLEKYAKDYHIDFNKAIREGIPLTEAQKRIEADLLEVTIDLDIDDIGPLYRGIRTDDAFEVGNQYVFPQWTSTSTGTSTPLEFLNRSAAPDPRATQTFFEIHGQTGMKGVVFNAQQQEVLLKRGTKFEVDAIYEDVVIEGKDRPIPRYIVARIVDETPPTTTSDSAPLTEILDAWNAAAAKGNHRDAIAAKLNVRIHFDELIEAATDTEEITRFDQLRRIVIDTGYLSPPPNILRLNAPLILAPPNQLTALTDEWFKIAVTDDRIAAMSAPKSERTAIHAASQSALQAVKDETDRLIRTVTDVDEWSKLTSLRSSLDYVPLQIEPPQQKFISNKLKDITATQTTHSLPPPTVAQSTAPKLPAPTKQAKAVQAPLHQDTPSHIATDKLFDENHSIFSEPEHQIAEAHKKRKNFVEPSYLPEDVVHYQGEGYLEFNANTRDGFLTNDDLEMNEALLSITHELGDESAPLYRGMRTFDSHIVDRTYALDTWTSTSASPIHARAFLDEFKVANPDDWEGYDIDDTISVMFEIHTTPKTQAAIFNANEAEFLLPPGTKYKVENIYDNVSIDMKVPYRGKTTVDIDEYIVIRVLDDTPTSPPVSNVFISTLTEFDINQLTTSINSWDRLIVAGQQTRAAAVYWSILEEVDQLISTVAEQDTLDALRRLRTSLNLTGPKGSPTLRIRNDIAAIPTTPSTSAATNVTPSRPSIAPAPTVAAPEPDALTLLIDDWDNAALSGDLAAARAARQEVRYEIDWLLGTVTDPDELRMINRLRNTLNQTSALDGKTKRIDSNLLDIRNARKTPTTTTRRKPEPKPKDTPPEPTPPTEPTDDTVSQLTALVDEWEAIAATGTEVQAQTARRVLLTEINAIRKKATDQDELKAITRLRNSVSKSKPRSILSVRLRSNLNYLATVRRQRAPLEPKLKPDLPDKPLPKPKHPPPKKKRPAGYHTDPTQDDTIVDADADRIRRMIDQWEAVAQTNDVRAATQARTALRKIVNELRNSATNPDDAKRFARLRNSLNQTKAIDGPSERIRNNLRYIEERPGRPRVNTKTTTTDTATDIESPIETPTQTDQPQYDQHRMQGLVDEWANALSAGYAPEIKAAKQAVRDEIRKFTLNPEVRISDKLRYALQNLRTSLNQQKASPISVDVRKALTRLEEVAPPPRITPEAPIKPKPVTPTQTYASTKTGTSRLKKLLDDWDDAVGDAKNATRKRAVLKEIKKILEKKRLTSDERHALERVWRNVTASRSFPTKATRDNFEEFARIRAEAFAEEADIAATIVPTQDELPAFVPLEEGFTPPRSESPFRRQPQVDPLQFENETDKYVVISGGKQLADDPNVFHPNGPKWKHRSKDQPQKDFQQTKYYEAESFGVYADENLADISHIMEARSHQKGWAGLTPAEAAKVQSNDKVLSFEQIRAVTDDMARSAGIQPYTVVLAERANPQEALDRLLPTLEARVGKNRAKKVSEDMFELAQTEMAGSAWEEVQVLLFMVDETGHGQSLRTVIHEGAHMVNQELRRLDEAVLKAAREAGEDIPAEVAQRWDDALPNHGVAFVDTVTDAFVIWGGKDRDTIVKKWDKWKIQSSDTRAPRTKLEPISPLPGTPRFQAFGGDRRPRPGESRRVVPKFTNPIEPVKLAQSILSYLQTASKAADFDDEP